MEKNTAAIYGLSTEGYNLGMACVKKGIKTNIIDESLGKAIRLREDTIQKNSTVNLVSNDSTLVFESISDVLKESQIIFFTPRIRGRIDELQGEIITRLKDVAKHLTKETIFIYSLPTSIGGNNEILEIIEQISGLKHNKEFRYGYAPMSIDNSEIIARLPPIKESEMIKDVFMDVINSIKIMPTLELAELEYARYILNRYSNIAIDSEVYSRFLRIDKRIREEANESPIFIDQIMNVMIDLRLLSNTLRGGDPLLHVISGILKSFEWYIKRLVEHVRNQIRDKQLKASRTRISIYWSIDEHEIRGEKIQTLNLMENRFRDFVSEINIIKPNSPSNFNPILGSGRDEKNTIIIACSKKDQEKAKEVTKDIQSDNDLIIQANLLMD